MEEISINGKGIREFGCLSSCHQLCTIYHTSWIFLAELRCQAWSIIWNISSWPVGKIRNQHKYWTSNIIDADYSSRIKRKGKFTKKLFYTHFFMKYRTFKFLSIWKLSSESKSLKEWSILWRCESKQTRLVYQFCEQPYLHLTIKTVTDLHISQNIV